MNKGASKTPAVDLSRYCRSTFTLTFGVEILGLEVWTDCNEGWLDQGPYVQGMKIQYQLYPGQTFDLDILIWPHTAKIWCGTQYGWVRTWQLLERRWLTFSIVHCFPVRVTEFQQHMATVVPTVGVGSLGSNAKNDKNFEVYLPPLGFGVRRYFAPVLEAEERLLKFMYDLIWKAVEEYIPWSCFDEWFDTPHVVTDVRHQDACIDAVRDIIFKRMEPEEIEKTIVEQEEPRLSRRESKMPKEKEKKKIIDMPKVKFEIRLSGEHIMAGIGRIVPFETIGDPIPESPEVIALISSNNLPAQDDLPIVFVNVENLYEIPVNELKALRVTHLYTKWKIGEEEHCSEPQPLRNKATINFNDHKALPISHELLSKIASDFLDTYTIEIRAIKWPRVPAGAKLFGYEKGDRDFATVVPKSTSDELDFLVAISRIDARPLAKGVNSFLRGEYPLYPPSVTVKMLEREGFCTNDINSIRASVTPELIVKPDVILQAQMSLEVCMGIVGCNTRKISIYFSRMFCVIKNSDEIMKLLRNITDINETILTSGEKESLMSGFAIDTGNLVVLYVEGPKDGHILRVWDMTEDFYPEVKPVFSCSARYSTRIYPELLVAAVPFIILKMFVPLGILLACPPIYARPALPLPTRSIGELQAVLKIGRLVGSELRTFPSRCQMPTANELKSFRLELCVAPRPAPVIIAENNLEKAVVISLALTWMSRLSMSVIIATVMGICGTYHQVIKKSSSILALQDQARTSLQSVSRINWDK